MRHIIHFKELNNYKILEQSLNNTEKNIDINQIVYGNAPIEFKEIIENKNDLIKNWFEKEGLIDKIINEAPLNDSETTKKDLDQLIELTKNATGDDITFSRYADDQNNLPNLFLSTVAIKYNMNRRIYLTSYYKKNGFIKYEGLF